MEEQPPATQEGAAPTDAAEVKALRVEECSEEALLAAMDEDGDLDLPRQSSPAQEESEATVEPEDLVPESSDTSDTALLEALLNEPGLGASLAALLAAGHLSRLELRGLRQLAEQSVHMGIDYRTLGLGWHHPQSRTAYREGRQPSTAHAASRARAERSRIALVELARSLAGSDGCVSAGETILTAFCDEISAAEEPRKNATVEAGLAALEAELLLPLRALNEDRFAGSTLARTFNGDPLPAGRMEAKVDEITGHVLAGTFSIWRYSNRIGARQLDGLSDAQLALWMEPTRTECSNGLVVHEDAPGELGFFWATKIGGPSHGFDVEGQCLLPLLSNARHKVVLVSDPDWPYHPSGRAHLRLLWTADEETPRPVLWFETVNICFHARVDPRPWIRPILTHVARKAEAMGAILSVQESFAGELEQVVRSPGQVRIAEDRLLLRPSNAIVEASDYLGDHDWIQEEEEITRPLRRAVYESLASEGQDDPETCSKDS
eukprot:TRINITY_DN78450_c0_g1_i1.p1 TRINITY_DN78450_c0_g1~~TRINITY_DN78450_c0_g1_i1.p1  ORF type:complete len:499 (-),score=87.80 TRINITY_DN78450_c0_g1_i1:25-1500(-)